MLVLGLETYALLRASSCFIFGIGAASQDFFEQKIQNWVTYSFIAFGIVLGVLSGTIFQTIIWAITAFIFGLIVWKAGLWGAGDVKYFTGIAATIPTPYLLFGVVPLAYFLVSWIIGYHTIRGTIPKWNVSLAVFLFLANMALIVAFQSALINI